MKNKMKKITNFCINSYNKLIFILSFIFILFLTINSFLFTSYMPPTSIKYSENTFFYRDNILISLIVLIAFIMLGLFLKKIKIKSNTSKKIIKYILISLGFVSVVWVFMANYTMRADSWICFNAAKQFTANNFEYLQRGNYLFNYPYQLGLVFFDQILYRLFGNNAVLFFQIINCLSMILTIYLLIKIFAILFKKEDNNLLNCILLVLFIPFTFFCSFVYGNVISFSLSVISIYFFVLFNNETKKKKKIIFLILSVIFISLSYLIKSTALIVFISLIIISLIKFIDSKNKINLFYILLVIISLSIPLKFIYKYYESVSGIDINSGIPKIGWFAMGLHESSLGTGWFDGSQSRLYYEVNFDTEKYNEEALKDINNSLIKFEDSPKYALNFFYEKVSSQWNNPTFQSLWNLTDTGQNRIANSFIKGRLYNLTYVYTNYFQFIIYFGCLLFLILERKNLNYFKMYFFLIFIGGFVFYCFWEAKSQYIFHFFIILIPYASLGYDKLWNLIISKQKLKKIENNN